MCFWQAWDLESAKNEQKFQKDCDTWLYQTPPDISRDSKKTMTEHCRRQADILYCKLYSENILQP